MTVAFYKDGDNSTKSKAAEIWALCQQLFGNWKVVSGFHLFVFNCFAKLICLEAPEAINSQHMLMAQHFRKRWQEDSKVPQIMCASRLQTNINIGLVHPSSELMASLCYHFATHS